MQLIIFILQGMAASILYGICLVSDGMATVFDWIAAQAQRAAEWVLR